MKYFIKLGIGSLMCFSPFCFGTLQFQDVAQKNYLKIYALTVLCELDPELPICEPLEAYKVAKAELDRVVDENSEKLQELTQRGEEIFDSKVIPYIQTACENRDTAPSYLLSICELSDIINSVEGSQDLDLSEGVTFQPTFYLQSHQGFERIQHSQEFQFIKYNYSKMANIVIGITCDKEQGIVMPYCEFMKQITAHDEEFYKPKRVVLRMAEEELNSQLYTLCNYHIDKDKESVIPLYKKILCRDGIEEHPTP